ncbi:ParB N-terminal domain-containing protein [Bradyrhizobium sp. Arg62]|uniref:DUF6551 family protein n=1 Tax=Bradyrhizobium brasilense TaxID=1419277 RepID=UPI001E2E89A4|nr:DUF6551 family protein [Bradyrhizobium brasilense]MCC8945976.1 ParB N-terminal domain-containing protein [Bradyrhizobium brasilense]
MTALTTISGAKFRSRLTGKTLSDIDAKEKPRLFWIAITNLRVDERYQRRIHGRASEKSVLSIAENFSWAKFAPVVVAEIDGDDGLFAVIDGQHRTTAAALRGIRDVPCLVMKVGFADQADAFAAINGGVTAISTMQLYHARVAAGDPDAVALHEACLEAGVTICRYAMGVDEMKAGDTLAASRLARQLKRYGREILVAALSCITKTGDGNIGMVRAPVVEALCVALDAEPAWGGAGPALLEAMQSFDFFKAYSDARVRAVQEGLGISVPLVEIIGEHLEKALCH